MVMNNAPGKDTVGFIGEICDVVSTGETYKCIAIYNISMDGKNVTEYEWELMEKQPSSGGNNEPSGGTPDSNATPTINHTFMNLTNDMDIDIIVEKNDGTQKTCKYKDVAWINPYDRFGISNFITHMEKMFYVPRKDDGGSIHCARFANANSVTIRINFPIRKSIRKVAFTLFETHYPKSAYVYVETNKGKNLAGQLDLSVAPSNVAACYEYIFDLSSAIEKIGSNVKQRVVKNIEIVIMNPHTSNLGISDIKIEQATPYDQDITITDKYNYDLERGRVYYLDGTSVFGEPIVDINFDNYSGSLADMQGLFTLKGVGLEMSLVEGALRIKKISSTSDAMYSVAGSKIGYIEFVSDKTTASSFYSVGSLFWATAQAGGCTAGKCLFLDTAIIQNYGTAPNGDNYIDIKRIVLYPQKTLPAGIDYIEIINRMNRLG